MWLFGGAKYQGGDEAEARGTDGQPLSDKPPLIRCAIKSKGKSKFLQNHREEADISVGNLGLFFQS